MSRTPDLMPVLARGRHRTPRKGACFMEMASYLAGERWSDHPQCTHPLLARVARGVNDLVDDDHRHRLVRLIPDVVGLRSDDPRSHAWIAREAALAALPIAPERLQRVAAVGLVHCERVLTRLGAEDAHDPRCQQALDAAPAARDWAIRFSMIGESNEHGFVRRGAPAIVQSGLCGIAEALVSDRDETLIVLLERTVALCRSRFPAPAPAERPLPVG